MRYTKEGAVAQSIHLLEVGLRSISGQSMSKCCPYLFLKRAFGQCISVAQMIDLNVLLKIAVLLVNAARVLFGQLFGDDSRCWSCCLHLVLCT